MSLKNPEFLSGDAANDLPDLPDQFRQPAELPQMEALYEGPEREFGRIAIWRPVKIKNADLLSIVGRPKKLGLSVVNRRQAERLYRRSNRPPSEILKDIYGLEVPGVSIRGSSKPSEYSLKASFYDLVEHGPTGDNEGIHRVSLLLNHQGVAFKTLHQERDAIIDLFNVSPEKMPYTPKANHHVTIFASPEKDVAMDVYDQVEECLQEQNGNIRVRLGKLRAEYLEDSGQHRSIGKKQTYRYRP